MKLCLQWRLQLENIEEVVPDGEDFRWFVKVKCSNCGELSKWVYVTEEESIPLKGGRGSTNLLIKCKICGRENSLDILKNSIQPYTCGDSGSFKTVVVFECRGLEVTDFDPRNGFLVFGENKRTTYSDISLSDKEWYEYDENKQQPVSITDLEFKITRS